MSNRVKHPPDLCNVEAEASLLGAALIGGEEVLRLPIVRTVTPPDFWDRKHGDTWAAILQVVRRGLKVDCVTVADELEKRGQLDAVGGMPGLVAMVNACLSVMQADSYAAVVLDWSRRRKAEQALSALGAALYRDGDFVGAVSEAIARLNEVKWSTEASRPVHALADLLADETLIPEDIVDGLIPQNAVTFVSGPAGSCKSYVMLDLAVCVSSGVPWLGLDTRRTPVLVIDLENGPTRVRDRVQRVMRGHALETPPPITIAFGLSSRLDRDESVSEIAYQAESCDAGLVILDSLDFFLGEVDENSTVEMRKVARRLSAIAQTVGGAVIVHRTPQDSAQVPQGITVLGNGVDVTITVSRDGDNLTLTQLRNRTGPEHTMAVRLNLGDGLFGLSPILRLCWQFQNCPVSQCACRENTA